MLHTYSYCYDRIPPLLYILLRGGTCNFYILDASNWNFVRIAQGIHPYGATVFQKFVKFTVSEVPYYQRRGLYLPMTPLESFHMKCQRHILGIRWQDHIFNTEIAQRTRLPQFMDLFARRRNVLFVHVARLGKYTPAHQALGRQIDISLGRLPDGKRKRHSGRPKSKRLARSDSLWQQPAARWSVEMRCPSWSFRDDAMVHRSWPVTTWWWWRRYPTAAPIRAKFGAKEPNHCRLFHANNKNN